MQTTVYKYLIVPHVRYIIHSKTCIIYLFKFVYTTLAAAFYNQFGIYFQGHNQVQAYVSPLPPVFVLKRMFYHGSTIWKSDMYMCQDFFPFLRRLNVNRVTLSRALERTNSCSAKLVNFSFPLYFIAEVTLQLHTIFTCLD